MQLFILIFGFYIPMNAILFFKEPGQEAYHRIYCMVALGAQSYLFLHELVQMFSLGLTAYLGFSLWNLYDFFNFWANLAYFLLRYWEDFQTDEVHMHQTILLVVINLLSFTKLLFLVRIYKEIAFLVYMV